MSTLPTSRPEKGRPEVASPPNSISPQTVYVILDTSAESVNLIRYEHERITVLHRLVIC